MKFTSSIIAAVVLAVSSVQATGLIRGIAKTETLGEAEFGSATLTISHASTAGKWNNKIVSDAFKQAYNDVHTGEGAPTVSWSFVDMEVETAEGDGNVEPGSGRYWESTNWLKYKYICPNCSPEDKKNKKLLPPIVLQALESLDLHAEFETAFCKLIAQADPASFGEVTKCEIDFTYSLADSASQHNHGDSTDNNDGPANYEGSMKAEIDLSHVYKGDEDAVMLQNRINVMGNCLKDTYNLVHADSPYTVNSVTIDKAISVPENDGEDETALAVGEWFRMSYREWSRIHIHWGCNLCMPDDRKFVPPLAVSRLTMGEHQAFEATFGNCLRESGVWAFHKARNARISFAYTGNPDDSA